MPLFGWLFGKIRGHNTDLLIGSITDGDVDKVRCLLHQGVDVNRADKTRLTPVLAALAGDQAEILRSLLERGARLEWAHLLSYLSKDSRLKKRLDESATVDLDELIEQAKTSASIKMEVVEIMKLTLIERGEWSTGKLIRGR
jgi:ankyrin repeat protein